MQKQNVCRKCRRIGQKLFLKGEKCFSPKCLFLKKPYPPGEKSKKVRPGSSEYGRQLVEKRKMKSWYGLSEKQFKGYVKEVLEKRGKVGDASLELVRKIEKRLDNVVLKLGFASSRRQARQLVSHNLFLINKKAINVPSYRAKKGDVISIKDQKKENAYFKKIALTIKKVQVPSWLELDREKLIGKVIGDPTIEDVSIPVEIHSIFEYYSR